MAEAWQEGKMKRAVGKKNGDFSKEGMVVYEEVDVPKADKDNVVVQVKAAALNRIDDLRAKGSSCQWPPIYPCFDISGTVVAKGPDATGPLKVGDEVICCKYPPNNKDGGLAEYFIAPEHTIGPKPDSWSHVEGASLPMGILTAQKVVELGELKKEDKTVLVGASGFVGSMILVLNRTIGAPILAVASGAKADYVKKVGGSTVTVCDYKTEKWQEKFTKEDPPVVVFDVSSQAPTISYYEASKLGAKRFVTTNTLDPNFRFNCCCCCSELCWCCKSKCCTMCCGRPKYNLALFSTKDAGKTYKICSDLAAKKELEPVPLESFPPKQIHMAYGCISGTGKKAVIDLSLGKME